MVKKKTHTKTHNQPKKCRNLHQATIQAGEQRNVPFLLETKDKEDKLCHIDSTTG